VSEVPTIKRPKVALTLLGGGVTGAYFHYGALAALDDHLSRKSVDFDVFTGVSAGSLVASTLAVGLRPHDAVQSVMSDNRELFYIERKDIYRFSILDMMGDLLKFLWAFFYLCYLKINFSSEAPSFFWGLKDALPSGLFSMRYYEDWIRRFFERNQFPGYFSEIPKELYIPAYDLDLCKRIVFGSPGWKHVPIFKAIASSSAIPIFFQPTQIEDRFYIDGGMGENAHLDLAAEAQADLIIVINPMTPIRNDGQTVKIKTVFDDRGRIRDKGLTYVFDQSLRNDIHMKVKTAIQLFKYRYPDKDVLLLEPDTDDATMFLFNPMDFESRKQIVDYSYQLIRQKLRAQADLWRRVLDRHQITLTGVDSNPPSPLKSPP
jgi:predicted acylesterase/phospholipase RssA